MLIYVIIPLNNLTMLNLEVFYKGTYLKGTKYAVSTYNISYKVLNKLPSGPKALKYYLNIYSLTI